VRKLFFGLIFLFMLLGVMNSSPAVKALDQVDLWVGLPSESYVRNTVNDGTYIYFLTTGNPCVIIKADPATMLEVDRWTAQFNTQGWYCF
jgi:hypothetical protein